jgi:hypothetical protein
MSWSRRAVMRSSWQICSSEIIWIMLLFKHAQHNRQCCHPIS